MRISSMTLYNLNWSTASMSEGHTSITGKPEEQVALRPELRIWGYQDRLVSALVHTNYVLNQNRKGLEHIKNRKQTIVKNNHRMANSIVKRARQRQQKFGGGFICSCQQDSVGVRDKGEIYMRFRSEGL